MKALSIQPDYACLIFIGEKTVECRTWKTNYRGEILICSTAKKIKHTIPGHALCTVRLVDVVPFTEEHLYAACMDESEMPEDAYAWIFEDLRMIRPIPLKGKLSLWEYDGEVEYLKDPETDEEDDQMYYEIWEPLFFR